MESYAVGDVRSLVPQRTADWLLLMSQSGWETSFLLICLYISLCSIYLLYHSLLLFLYWIMFIFLFLADFILLSNTILSRFNQHSGLRSVIHKWWWCDLQENYYNWHLSVPTFTMKVALQTVWIHIRSLLIECRTFPPPLGHVPPYEKWHMRTSAPPSNWHRRTCAPQLKKGVGHLPPNQSG